MAATRSTYTSVAAGVDGHIQTRRVTAQVEPALRARHRLAGHVAEQDNISGVATVNAAGRARRARSSTRAASPPAPAATGRVFGVTNRDDNDRRLQRLCRARRSRPMPGRWRSTAPIASAMSRWTITAPAACSTTISIMRTAHSATASIGMAPRRRPAVRLDGRRRLCPREFERPLPPAFRGLICPRRRGRAGRPDPRRHRAASAMSDIQACSAISSATRAASR